MEIKALLRRAATKLTKPAAAEAALLLVLAVAAFCVRWHYAGFHKVMVPDYDGVTYIWLAERVFSGERFWTALMPPGFPAILSLFLPFFKSSQSAGMFVSALFGSGLCVAVYLFTRELFGRQAAALAAVLVAVFGQLVIVSTWVMSEMPFAFFLYLGLYAGAVFYRKSDAASALFFGGLFGVAYLIRPEAFLIFCMSCAAIAVSWTLGGGDGGRRDRLSRLALAALLFIAACAPYLAYVKGETGYWSLSGKARYNLAVTAEDKTLGSNTGTLGYFARNADKLLRKYRGNLAVLREIVASAYPAVLLLLAGVGAGVRAIGARRRPMSFFYPLVLFCAALTLPFFFMDVRILGPYYPLLLIWSAAGAAYVEKRLAGLGAVMRLHPVAAVLALGLSIHYISGLNASYNSLDYRARTEYLKIRYLETGRFLERRTSIGEKIVSRDQMFVYYAGRKAVYIGDRPAEDVYRLAREEGARYVVVDDVCLRKNSALGPLLAPFRGNSSSVPGFELVFADSRGGVLIYEAVEVR